MRFVDGDSTVALEDISDISVIASSTVSSVSLQAVRTRLYALTASTVRRGIISAKRSRRILLDTSAHARIRTLVRECLCDSVSLIAYNTRYSQARRGTRLSPISSTTCVSTSSSDGASSSKPPRLDRIASRSNRRRVLDVNQFMNIFLQTQLTNQPSQYRVFSPGVSRNQMRL